MGPYLIDTNIASFYLTDELTGPGAAFMDGVVDAGPVISVITRIELLSWVVDKKMEAAAKRFIDACSIIPLTEDIILRTVKIRRAQRLKTPDAIIAATAVELGFTVLSHDVAAFGRISGLKHINPMTIA